MELLQLKTTLRDIKANNYELTNQDMLQKYFELMLENLGHTDSELRDDLICSTLYQWILEKKYFPNQQLSELFDDLLTEKFLFYNIEANDTISIYKRSFTLLLLNPILCVHEEENFLSNDQMSHFRTSMFNYIRKEHDFRGYDKNNGWAHAFAHWADLTFFMTLGVEENESICEAVLQVIQEQYLRIKLPLTKDEDERLITNIAYSYLDENMISLEVFKRWIDSFKALNNIDNKTHKTVVQINVKQFIRSLYFRMRFIESPDEFMQPVIELEKHLNKFLFD